jgi:hypothetical protein
MNYLPKILSGISRHPCLPPAGYTLVSGSSSGTWTANQFLAKARQLFGKNWCGSERLQKLPPTFQLGVQRDLLGYPQMWKTVKNAENDMPLVSLFVFSAQRDTLYP